MTPHEPYPKRSFESYRPYLKGSEPFEPIRPIRPISPVEPVSPRRSGPPQQPREEDYDRAYWPGERQPGYENEPWILTSKQAAYRAGVGRLRLWWESMVHGFPRREYWGGGAFRGYKPEVIDAWLLDRRKKKS